MSAASTGVGSPLPRCFDRALPVGFDMVMLGMASDQREVVTVMRVIRAEQLEMGCT